MCPITLRTIRSDATPPAEFMYMNREGMNRLLLYDDCLFCDLHVRVLFDNFTMGVLRILNMAPTLLHSNRWAAMQAFRVLCSYSLVSAMPKLFLHYFCSCPQEKAQWMSLIQLPKRPFFSPFTYKNFKIGYFKVLLDRRKYCLIVTSAPVART